MTAEDREKVWGQTERAFSSFGAEHEWTRMSVRNVARFEAKLKG